MKSIFQLYKLGVNFPRTVLFVAILFTGLMFMEAKNLRIESDLANLLPKDAPSVQAVQEVKQYFAGLSYLFVVIESPDMQNAESYAEKLTASIEALPEVAYVDFRQPANFFKNRYLLYMSRDDLKEMIRRVEASFKLKGSGYSSIFNDLVDFADADQRPNLAFDDIFAKYQKRIGNYLSDSTGDDRGKFFLLKVKTKTMASNIDASRNFMKKIRELEKEARLDGEFKNITVGYTGGYQNTIEQVDLIDREIKNVSSVVLVVLFVIILLFFRRVSSAFMVGIPLVVSLIWTGGLVYLILGHLNIITGFGGAILSGLGSDYGIYLLSRYEQEKKLGTKSPRLYELAFAFTGRATYGSMITAVGSFLALLLSDFGVFREFGIVGAIGVVSAYIAMVTVLPAMLVLFDGKRSKKEGLFEKIIKTQNWASTPLFRKIFAPKQASRVLIISILCCLLSSIAVPTSSKINFESGLVETDQLPGTRLNKRVVKASGTNTLNPTVILAFNAADEENLVRFLEGKLEKDTAGLLPYKNVVGLTSLVPAQVPEKKKLLALLANRWAEQTATPNSHKEIFAKDIEHALAAPEVTNASIPEELKRVFISAVDKNVHAVFVYPNRSRGNAEEAQKYRSDIEDLIVQSGVKASLADSNFVTADTVTLIQKEAPRMMAAILFFLLLVMLFTVKPVNRALVIMGHLVAGLILLAGAMIIFDVQLNILNIAALTIVLGTGIDSFIHFNQRYDETEDIMDTLKNKVSAVVVANITSIVGLGGLMFTSSEGIRSIGWLAFLGLMISMLLALFIFPRCLVLMKGKK